MQASFITSAAGPSGFPVDSGAEVAVVGRSNSGKSSAINRIVGHGKLARVSKTPGRTQLINFFSIGEDRRLVDLPGYGYAKVPERLRREWRLLVEAYFSGRASLRGLLLTVDIRHGPNERDRAMIDWARRLELPLMLLLTKADKLSRGAGMRELEALRKEFGRGVLLCRFSALDGTGVEEARAQLCSWLGIEA